jgi:predicted Zn-dependent protease
VKAIAARVIPTTSVFRPDAPSWAWEVNVIQSEELNAWCMPGGKIAFYSGIITKLQLNDDEIAAIMGHEIAHALREHGRERASEQMTSGLLVNVGVIALGGNQAMAEMAGLAYNVTVGLPNSRTHETEADRIGIELSARAGYDPKAAVTLWQKMAKLGGAKGPQFLSTHPSNEGRIKDLEGYSVRVQPLYEQARAKR